VNGATGDESGEWRTFGERSVYKSPAVELGQIDVEVRGGERIWHDVVRLPRVALMLLLDDNDRVLLLRHHRLIQDRWGWELPGGQVDEDEDPVDAVQRELEEETGYRAGRIEQLIIFEPLASVVDAEHLAYVGREPERIGDPTDTAEQIAQAEWTPLTSVPDLIAAGEIWNAGSLLALLRLLMKDA
jgi:8-oxo-dGTP pyrophosphatase MutT (NUDIX family)